MDLQLVPKSSRDLEQEQAATSELIKRWARMLVDPLAEPVRAPSLSRDYCSIASTTYSFDIDGSSSLDHTIAVTPDPLMHVLNSTSSVDLVPAASNVTFDQVGGVESTIPVGYATPILGSFMVTKADFIPAGIVNFVPDLVVANPALAGYSGLAVLGTATTDYKFSVDFKGISAWFRVYTIKGAAFTYSTPKYCAANNVNSANATLPVGGCDYIGIQICNSAGVPISAPRDLSVNLGFEFDSAIVTTSLNYSLAARVVRSSLLDEQKITHVRCTAIKMLCTDMTPEIDAGGELVTARASANLFTSASSTQTLMSNIKALPEQLIWRSGKIKDGAFGFYMPDDLESYEPGSATSPQSNNFLYACLSFAKPTGKLRVTVSANWEYYTPRQVIPRALNYPWDEESKSVFSQIMSQPAWTENPAHMGLIAGIVAAAKGTAALYRRNAHWINPLVQSGGRMLYEAVRNKDATAQSLGAAPPPRPPRKIVYSEELSHAPVPRQPVKVVYAPPKPTRVKPKKKKNTTGIQS